MKSTMIMLAMAATTLMSCSKVENPNSETDPVTINFGANIAVTKAVIDSDENLPHRPIAAVPIQIVRGQDGDPVDVDWATVGAIASTGTIAATTGIVTVDTPQFMNPNKTTANFLAYAPEATGFTAGIVSFEINGTQDIIVTEAQGVVFATNPYCALPFKHVLTQVELVVKAEDARAVTDFGKLTLAEISAQNQMELTLSAVPTLAPKNSSTTAPFQFYNGDTAYDYSLDLTTEAVTIGRTLIFATPNTPLANIKLGFTGRPAEDYQVNLQLVAGQKHIITATVKSTGIGVTSVVVPWGNGEDKGITVQ